MKNCIFIISIICMFAAAAANMICPDGIRPLDANGQMALMACAICACLSAQK